MNTYSVFQTPPRVFVTTTYQTYVLGTPQEPPPTITSWLPHVLGVLDVVTEHTQPGPPHSALAQALLERVTLFCQSTSLGYSTGQLASAVQRYLANPPLPLKSSAAPATSVTETPKRKLGWLAQRRERRRAALQAKMEGATRAMMNVLWNEFSK